MAGGQAVINREIHYDVLFARTEHSYINNYPIEFTLFNYSVRDILLDTPWRIAATRILTAETNVEERRDADVVYC